MEMAVLEASAWLGYADYDVVVGQCHRLWAAGGGYVPVEPAKSLPAGCRQEAFAQVSANAAAAVQSVYGGDDILPSVTRMPSARRSTRRHR